MYGPMSEIKFFCSLQVLLQLAYTWLRHVVLYCMLLHGAILERGNMYIILDRSLISLIKPRNLSRDQ
jgi:hypothetical protein